VAEAKSQVLPCRPWSGKRPRENMNKRFILTATAQNSSTAFFENIMCLIMGYITDKTPVLSLRVRDSIPATRTKNNRVWTSS
jgi:hypothetical protein